MSAEPQKLLSLGPPVRVQLIEEAASATYGAQIRSASDVWRSFESDLRRWDRERFLSIILDGAHRVIGLDTVAVGTLTSCNVHPREVMKALILANAAAFIAVHNHPSGDLTPSDADREVTRTLRLAGDVLGIRLLDHVIVSPAGFYSFQEHGLV